MNTSLQRENLNSCAVNLDQLWHFRSSVLTSLQYNVHRSIEIYIHIILLLMSTEEIFQSRKLKNIDIQLLKNMIRILTTIPIK